MIEIRLPSHGRDSRGFFYLLYMGEELFRPILFNIILIIGQMDCYH